MSDRMCTRAPLRGRGRAGLRPGVRCVLSRAGLAAVLLLPFCMNVAQAALPPVDLTSLSLEDLMNVKVTSVSRRPQSLAETAAAVFVITQDDIRRSGVTNIPPALRIVPPLQHARPA